MGLAGGGVESFEDELLAVGGEAASLGGSTDHLVGDAGRVGGDEVLRTEIVRRQDAGEGLFAEVAFDGFVHGLNRRAEETDFRLDGAGIFENESGCRGAQFVAVEDKFGVEAVAGGLVDILAGEATAESVFEVIVGADAALRAIRGEGALLVEHDELGRVPGFAGLADPAPNFVILLVETPGDKVVAGGLGSDGGSHRLLASGDGWVGGLTAGEDRDGKKGEKGVGAHEMEKRITRRAAARRVRP